MRAVLFAFIISVLVLASTSYAFYFGTYGGSSYRSGFSGFSGYSYSNYGYSSGYSSNLYFPTSYRSGYYSNPFGAYYGAGSGYYGGRSSASFLFRSW